MVFSTSYVLNVHNAHGFLRANKKINLKGKTTIDVVFESPASIGGPPLYLCIKQNDTAMDGMTASSSIKSGNTSATLDVSTYDGEYYVGIAAGNSSGASSVDAAQVIIS